MLQVNRIDRVVDVRTVPGSRHNPQFAAQALSQSLAGEGIGYAHLAALGGLRHTPATQQSLNTSWRNRSFRSYADYMQTVEFRDGVVALLALATGHTVAMMCAEAVPWRCHRSLIADALLIRHIPTKDIMSLTSTKPHTLTPFAHVDGDRVWYPLEGDRAGV